MSQRQQSPGTIKFFDSLSIPYLIGPDPGEKDSNARELPYIHQQHVWTRKMRSKRLGGHYSAGLDRWLSVVRGRRRGSLG